MNPVEIEQALSDFAEQPVPIFRVLWQQSDNSKATNVRDGNVTYECIE